MEEGTNPRKESLTLSTPLSYLMSLTKTSAKEIAEQTGINVTLLSKFKNGQRKLQYHSRYPLLLADFFLQCRAEQSAHVVTDLLVRHDGALAGASYERLQETLTLGLCADMIEESLPAPAAPAVEVFRSVTELKGMLEQFTAQVLAAEPGKVCILHDFPDMESSTSFLEFSLPYLEQIRKHGCTIRIQDNCPAPKTYMSIFNWLEFYFSDRVQLFSDYEHRHLHRMTFVREDTCALVILSNDVGQKFFHASLFTDPKSTGAFRQMSVLAATSSTRIIEKIPFSSIMDFLHTLDRFLVSQPTTFLVNPVMMYKTMSLDILAQVLDENGIPEDRYKGAFETNRFTAYLRTKCPYKQIYDLTAMKRVAAMDSTVDEELSQVYGRPISVSRRLLHEHLKQLTRLNAPESYHLLFVPFERLHLLHSSISYVIQRDSLFLAWDASRSDHRIYSRDNSIVTASYNYMEEIWNSIPAEFTTPEWQAEQIQMLLDLSAD